MQEESAVPTRLGAPFLAGFARSGDFDLLRLNFAQKTDLLPRKNTNLNLTR
jgi:hypothetical protein